MLLTCVHDDDDDFYQSLLYCNSPISQSDVNTLQHNILNKHVNTIILSYFLENPFKQWITNYISYNLNNSTYHYYTTQSNGKSLLSFDKQTDCHSPIRWIVQDCFLLIQSKSIHQNLWDTLFFIFLSSNLSHDFVHYFTFLITFTHISFHIFIKWKYKDIIHFLSSVF